MENPSEQTVFFITSVDNFSTPPVGYADSSLREGAIIRLPP